MFWVDILQLTRPVSRSIIAEAKHLKAKTNKKQKKTNQTKKTNNSKLDSTWEAKEEGS